MFAMKQDRLQFYIKSVDISFDLIGVFVILFFCMEVMIVSVKNMLTANVFIIK